MPTLADLSCTAQFGHKTSSTTVNGIPVSTSETTEITIQLPKKPAVQAVFSTEGFARKLMKLFTSEVQTGDRAFDDAVYISTTTTSATAAWLAAEPLRTTLAEHVANGTFEIQEDTVKFTVFGHVDEAPSDVVSLVASLLE